MVIKLKDRTSHTGEQEEIPDKTFTDRMDGPVQIDNVCVLGLRIYYVFVP
ncbi:MAG: hypothetical protein IIB05_04090 [Bacteroidetes bacterium]|nr:hypothetical protein [Bacteroidota bacterium]